MVFAKTMLRATSKRAGRLFSLGVVVRKTGVAAYGRRQAEESKMAEDREGDLEKRRAQLGAELATKRVEAGKDEADEARAEVSRQGYAQAMKLSSEFISAVVVGAVLGYLFDRFVGTAPWGLIVLLLLGFGAGVLNVMRAAGKVAKPDLDLREDDRK
jgi:ATP synthase protein I